MNQLELQSVVGFDVVAFESFLLTALQSLHKLYFCEGESPYAESENFVYDLAKFYSRVLKRTFKTLGHVYLSSKSILEGFNSSCQTAN